jgi:predicted secreted acid phosphatase
MEVGVAGSPKIASHRAPVLVFPHPGASDEPVFTTVRTPEYVGIVAGSDFPRSADSSNVSRGPLSIFQWAMLATRFPNRIKDYMMFPQSAPTLEGLWSSQHNRELPFRFPEGAESPFVDGRRLITGAYTGEVSEALMNGGASELGLVILFNPNTDEYRVEIRQLPSTVEQSADAAASSMLAGAWQLTSMNGYSDVLSGIISDPSTVIQIEGGSRVLLVQDGSLVAHPAIVSYKANGTHNTEIWTLPAGQPRPGGSSSALIINDQVSERVRALDIITALQRTAEAGMKADPSKEKKKIVSDLDGTLFDARAFVKQLFMEWFDGYDGVRQEELAKKVIWARENDPSLLIGWNSASVLQNLDILDERVVDSAKAYFGDDFENSTKQKFLAWAAKYEGVRKEDLQEAIKAAFKDEQNPNLLEQKSVRKILQGLAITDKRLKIPAMEHFNANFFSPDRRVDAPIIEGMVELVRFLQENGFEMMFVTLRSEADDTMRDGRSSSQVALQRAGIWQVGKSTLLRHEGKKLDWSEEAYKKGNNEPEKWEMVFKWMDINPDSLIVGALENAPAHVNGYRDAFEYEMVYVHPQGDDPPHSPRLTDGVFTVNTAQLAEEIADLKLRGFQPLTSMDHGLLTGPAWETVMANYTDAIGHGQTPVMILDIDDTVVETSSRTKEILGRFLLEHVEANPGDEWVLEMVSDITPSQIEYGIEDTLRAAGLEGLGIEEEFKQYFLEHFFSNEFLSEDQVRPGAVDFVKTLLAMGVKVKFLTGRLKGDMEAGTIDSLRELGFPIDDAGVDLFMREDPNETDADFKARAQYEIADGGMVIGVADNEPENLAVAARAFPRAGLFFVGGKHISSADLLPRGTTFIQDFSGEISEAVPRARPNIGVALREKGRGLADGLTRDASRIWNSLASPYYMDKRSFYDDIIREAVEGADVVLREVVTLPKKHPQRVAFFEGLNEFLSKGDGNFERFESSLHKVGYDTSITYVISRGTGGVADIGISTNGVVPEDLIIKPGVNLDTSPLASFAGVPLVLEPAQVEQIISAVPSGPELSGIGNIKMGDELVFGNFPRMNILYGWAVSAIAAATGKDPSEMLVIEYGPGRALASMVAWVRAGLNVGWREIHESRRLQTEVELMRLPDEIKGKISHVPQGEEVKPDIVVWNYPQHSVTPVEMVSDLLTGDQCGSGLGFAGFFIVQTEAPDQIVFDDESSGLTVESMMSMPMKSGEYVMPSAYGFIGRPTFKAFSVGK